MAVDLSRRRQRRIRQGDARAWLAVSAGRSLLHRCPRDGRGSAVAPGPARAPDASQERRPPEHRRHLRDCAGRGAPGLTRLQFLPRKASPISESSNGQESRREAFQQVSPSPEPAVPGLEVEGEARLLLRQRQGRWQSPHEGPARRQGIGPGRDDERRAAGAAGLHDFDRGLHHLLRAEGKDLSGHRSRDRGEPPEAREGRRRRFSDRPATRCSSRCGRAPSSRCPA